MLVDVTHERWAFVSTEPAGSREIRRSMAAVLLSFVVFLAAAPFAGMALPQVPAFIPIYVSTLVICDLITAALLFGQYSVLRSTPLLILAGGYLFTASITGAYALIFPGMFSPTGLFGAGPQATSAMYMLWHSGFPLFVIAYTWFRSTGLDVSLSVSPPSRGASRSIVFMITSVLALALGCLLLATLGAAFIPEFLHGNRTTDLGHVVLAAVWSLSFVALWALWRKRPHTVLDVWLLVVLCVWLFDIALAAILNTGRYDLGWYVGRIYGLVSASFLLLVLLAENGRQYARLVQMSVELSHANRTLAQLSRHDGLTSLPNRRFFDEYLGEQIALAGRNERSLALILCDVDYFKSYNDHHGHPVGDESLRQVAAALQSCCKRPTDMAARYGGEEFALVLPDTDRVGAIKVAEAVRAAVGALKIQHGHSAASPWVSVSGGIATTGVQLELTAAQLISIADQGLYQAKSQGRNQILCQQEA